jgi:pyridoxine 5-phosphate synthase
MINTKLSVNINKVALIRNSRGNNIPDVLKFALDCEEYGADGITVHPRPDERHIRYSDIPLLKENIKTELNIEGFPTDRFIKLVIDNKPAQVTLVPDPPNVLTSEEGWNVDKNKSFLNSLIKEFQLYNIRVSLFIEPNLKSVEDAKEVGSDRIEFYTGHYAKDFNKSNIIEKYKLAAKKCNELDIGINAGHDLNLQNLKFFKSNIGSLEEVSIGHALISDALYYGIKNTISMYKNLLK